MNDNYKRIFEFITKFKDLTILGTGTIITSAIGGIFWLYLASLLGTEQYGELSYYISIATIASTISIAGMSNTIIVYGAKGIKLQSSSFAVGIISSIITTIILFYFVVSDIGVSLYVFGFVVFSLITSNLIGQKLFSKYSKVVIIQKILLVTISIGLFHIIGFEGVILGMGISFIPFAYYVIDAFRKITFDFSILKNRFRFILNSFLLDISTAFNGSLDKIIIAPLLGYTLLGNYHLGLQFMGLLSIVPGIFFQYLLPQDASGNSTKTIKIFMILISGILAIASILLTPIIVPWLFPKFFEAIEIIQIMSISIISSTIISAYVSKFLGETKSKIVIIGSGIYLATQIPLLLILGNIYGVNGAAVSVVIASIAHMTYFIFIERPKKNIIKE